MSGLFVPFVRGTADDYADAVSDSIPLYQDVSVGAGRAWMGTAATCGVLVAALIAIMPALPSQDARGRSQFGESQPATAPIVVPMTAPAITPRETAPAVTAPDRDVAVRGMAAHGVPSAHRDVETSHRSRA